MENSTDKPKTSSQFQIAAASLAFLMWGGWAFWINGGADLLTPHSTAPLDTPVISGLTQGSCSFVITLVMVHLVTALYRVVPRSTQLVVPGMVTVAGRVQGNEGWPFADAECERFGLRRYALHGEKACQDTHSQTIWNHAQLQSVRGVLQGQCRA